MAQANIREQDTHGNESSQDTHGNESGREQNYIASDAQVRFKEDVKARYPIDQAVEDFSDTVIKGPKGRGQTVLCPFHDDTTPSMSIRPREGYSTVTRPPVAYAGMYSSSSCK